MFEVECGVVMYLSSPVNHIYARTQTPSLCKRVDFALRLALLCDSVIFSLHDILASVVVEMLGSICSVLPLLADLKHQTLLDKRHVEIHQFRLFTQSCHRPQPLPISYFFIHSSSRLSAHLPTPLLLHISVPFTFISLQYQIPH